MSSQPTLSTFSTPPSPGLMLFLLVYLTLNSYLTRRPMHVTYQTRDRLILHKVYSKICFKNIMMLSPYTKLQFCLFGRGFTMENEHCNDRAHCCQEKHFILLRLEPYYIICSYLKILRFIKAE